MHAFQAAYAFRGFRFLVYRNIYGTHGSALTAFDTILTYRHPEERQLAGQAPECTKGTEHPAEGTLRCRCPQQNENQQYALPREEKAGLQSLPPIHCNKGPSCRECPLGADYLAEPRVSPGSGHEPENCGEQDHEDQENEVLACSPGGRDSQPADGDAVEEFLKKPERADPSARDSARNETEQEQKANYREQSQCIGSAACQATGNARGSEYVLQGTYRAGQHR